MTFLRPGVGEGIAVGMFEKGANRMEERGWNKLTVDEFRGMDAIGKRALVRAIESTVLKGNPLVLTQDGQLVAACSSIKKYTDEINELGKTLSLQMPELVDVYWIERLDLPSGEKGALKKLAAARAAAQEKAKDALAAGIVRVFEERNRADKELAKGRDEALADVERAGADIRGAENTRRRHVGAGTRGHVHLYQGLVYHPTRTAEQGHAGGA